MKDEGYEWDDDKAKHNLAWHGLSFSEARKVIEDPNSIDDIDDRFHYDEERSNRIGMADGRVLTVAYTMRDDRFRIISVRRATKRECDDYFRQDD
jgi:uncharacterized protein